MVLVRRRTYCVGGPFLFGVRRVRIQLFGRVDGWHGTVRTIRQMQRLVDQGKKDPTVQFTARQIARKHHPKSYLGQARGIFEFVKKYIHYVRDPRDVELIHAPLYTLQARAGDCDDQVILFCSLAEAIGFKCRFKTIKADPKFPTEFSHIYSEIHVPGKGWMPADTIVERAKLGWEAPGRFESRTWGGLGMFGQEAAPAVAPEKRSFWGRLSDGFANQAGKIGNMLGAAVADQTGEWLNVPPPAKPGVPGVPAARPGLPGWVLPAGVVGAGILGVGGIMMMKRRRRNPRRRCYNARRRYGRRRKISARRRVRARLR